MEDTQTTSKRGKSFSAAQDVAICNAWLSVTQDVAHGVSQSTKNFWNKVLDNYINNTDDHARSRVSLLCRWSKIMKNCNKLQECINQAENRQQNGISEAEKVLQAKQLYLEMEKKHFSFDHCWPILQHSQKWHNIPYDSPQSSSPPDVLVVTPITLQPDQDLFAYGDGSLNTKRPCKRKAETEPWRKSNGTGTTTSYCHLSPEFKKNACDMETQLAVTEERKLKMLEEEHRTSQRRALLELRIMEEKHAREEKEKDDVIMMIDTSSMEPQTKAYYELRKREIYGNLVNRCQNLPAYSGTCTGDIPNNQHV